MTQTPGFLPFEQRGEWTAPDGRLYHRTSTAEEHVGSWLTCDACNPVQVVQPDTDTTGPELLYLRTEYAEAKADKERADEREAELKAKLRTALSEATNGALRAALHVPGYRPLTLTYGERWTVDSKRLKAEQPVTYAAYARLGGSWTLQESKGQQP